MEKKTISGQTLAVCLEQKFILLTRISDITKQIEVQSRQDTMQLGDLPVRRQVYIDRLKKCGRMIAASCRALPERERERREKILSGDFPKEDCTPEETVLLKYAVQCRDVLQKTLKMDRDARGRIQKECDRLQQLLHAARNTKKRKSPRF